MAHSSATAANSQPMIIKAMKISGVIANRLLRHPVGTPLESSPTQIKES